MAAILDPNDNLKIQSLSSGVKKVLPFYARPIFIRIVTKMDMTGLYLITSYSTIQYSFFLSYRHVQNEESGSSERRLQSDRDN